MSNWDLELLKTTPELANCDKLPIWQAVESQVRDPFWIPKFTVLSGPLGSHTKTCTRLYDGIRAGQIRCELICGSSVPSDPHALTPCPSPSRWSTISLFSPHELLLRANFGSVSAWYETCLTPSRAFADFNSSGAGFHRMRPIMDETRSGRASRLKGEHARTRPTHQLA